MFVGAECWQMQGNRVRQRYDRGKFRTHSQRVRVKSVVQGKRARQRFDRGNF